MSLLAFGVVLPWMIVGFGCWIGYLLLRQSGRILQRLEQVEECLARLAPPAVPSPARAPAPALPTGLAVGSEAPLFDLPTLAGRRTALSDFRGRRLLLIFFNRQCGFCTQMAAELAALPTDGSNGRPIPLVVTTGDAEQNRHFFAEHGIRCPVLLEVPAGTVGGGGLAARYQAGGTPMGYLIDEAGRIASELAAGAEALLRLAQDEAPAVIANGKPLHHSNRTLADSRIPREGLPAGTPAPSFTLPRLDGGELSLEDFRGRPLLLIFSDPACGPCDTLAPRLEEAHRRSGSVRLLMVSRGEVEANRAKVRQQGLTFPVVLQRHWEVSRRYAMFATPVAYLINEAGLIAAEVATGPEAVMALLARAGESDESPRCGCGKAQRECGCRGREARLAVPQPG